MLRANGVDSDLMTPERAVRSGSTLFAILSASFWTHYSVVKPQCSNFRMLTAIFLGVRIFSDFYVMILETMAH